LLILLHCDLQILFAPLVLGSSPSGGRVSPAATVAVNRFSAVWALADAIINKLVAPWTQKFLIICFHSSNFRVYPLEGMVLNLEWRAIVVNAESGLGVSCSLIASYVSKEHGRRSILEE